MFYGIIGKTFYFIFIIFFYIKNYLRIWCLGLLSEYENKNSKCLNESCLRKEIMLCNKFLEKDERNFHVWNYRLTIFKMIFQFFKNNFWDFLKEELEFTLKMIKKSFSNFSAWHYRSKLITLDLVNKNLAWSSSEILDYFKNDLFYIKNAIFTDPRDQSPWNYYFWILTNITPIYIKSIETDKYKVKIKLSQKIPIDKFLEIKINCITDKNHKIPVNDNVNNNNININDFCIEESNINKQSISEIFGDELNLDFEKLFNFDGEFIHKFKDLNITNTANVCFDISINGKNIDQKSQLFSEEILKLSNNICTLKNNLDFSNINFSLNNQGIDIIVDVNTYSLNNYNYEHLKTFLKTQLEMMDDLINNTDGFIENAHFRKVQILMFIDSLKFDQNTKLIKDELLFLIEKSKRMKEVYKNMIKSL